METPNLEQRINEMYERSDAEYFDTLNKVVDRVRDEARMSEIEAELGRLSAILREVYPQWEKLIHERIEVATRLQ